MASPFMWRRLFMPHRTTTPCMSGRPSFSTSAFTRGVAATVGAGALAAVMVEAMAAAIARRLGVHPQRVQTVHWGVRRSVSTTGVLSTARNPHQPAASANAAPARLPYKGTAQEPVQLKSNT